MGHLSNITLTVSQCCRGASPSSSGRLGQRLGPHLLTELKGDGNTLRYGSTDGARESLQETEDLI
ncbi:hypothetical protein EYF80_061171 [Liparis tanakae]|uniref:Uncharacterized protein n=1 Tax=Liparis tanakae TaxID=230148 RepID=A0A4Z2EJC7_9TELE|nr:hypothetical protein EYF80_061171 [Liparis tanakae]